MNEIIQFLTDFPDDSRVWFFMLNRPCSDKEGFLDRLHRFMTQWAAHGKSLAAKGALIQDRLLVIAVNEHLEGASGCSIDTLNRFLRDEQAIQEVDFFNRMQVVLAHENALIVVDEASFASALQYDSNVVQTHLGKVGIFRNEPTIPASSSWVKKYLAIGNVLE